MKFVQLSRAGKVEDNKHLVKKNLNRVKSLCTEVTSGERSGQAMESKRPIRAVLRENLFLGFINRSDTNQAVQPLKKARGLKILI